MSLGTSRNVQAPRGPWVAVGDDIFKVLNVLEGPDVLDVLEPVGTVITGVDRCPEDR